MKSKIMRKSVAIFMLISILLSSISNIVLATEISSAYLQNRGDCGLHLQYYNSDKGIWSYVTCTFVTYTENGNEYPAYCLNSDLHRSRRGRRLYS